MLHVFYTNNKDKKNYGYLKIEAVDSFGVLFQIWQIFADVITVRTLSMFLHVHPHVRVQRRQVVAMLALDPRHRL